MPKWTPGKQSGKNVNVAYTVPINFALNDNKTEGTNSVKKEIYNKNGWLAEVDAGGALSMKVTGKNVNYKLVPADLQTIVIEYYKKRGWDASFDENGAINMTKIDN